MTSGGQFDQLVRPFAESILPLAETLRADSELTRYQRSRVREAVVVLVRKACDVTIPAARLPEVSAQAARLAAEKGIDLREQTWHSQPKFDPKREVFHYEHMTPVTAIVEEIVAEAATADAVVDVLERHLRLAWITKIEDQELSRLGFKSKRPDPTAAYAAAGIELVGSTPAEPTPSERVMSPPVATSHSRAATGTVSTIESDHERGFFPVAEGETFRVVQLGLCLQGVVNIHDDAGSSLWSVGADTTLFDAQGRGKLARTARGELGYREVALYNPSTGTLILADRTTGSAGSESSELSLGGAAVQLVPPDGEKLDWETDLDTIVARSVAHTLSEGGQLRVELGGWDAPYRPFCSVELASDIDGRSILYFEASPIPHESRWWKNRMTEVDATTARLMLLAPDFKPDQIALLLRDAMSWKESPWNLALTFASPPTAVQPQK